MAQKRQVPAATKRVVPREPVAAPRPIPPAPPEDRFIVEFTDGRRFECGPQHAATYRKRAIHPEWLDKQRLPRPECAHLIGGKNVSGVWKLADAPPPREGVNEF